MARSSLMPQRCYPAETMRQLNRLLRYLRPYWLHILASVLAMALVGVLEAFRLAADRPHLRSGAESLVAWPQPAPVPHAHHQPADPVGLVRSAALSQRVDDGGLRPGRLHRAEGAVRLPRHLPGQLRRLRHDHRPAQRTLHGDPAALGGVLPEVLHRHVVVGDCERHRPRAVRGVHRGGGIPAAVLYLPVHRRGGHPARRTPDLGARHLCSRHYSWRRGGSASACAPPPARARTRSPTSRTSCRRPSPASAS